MRILSHVTVTLAVIIRVGYRHRHGDNFYYFSISGRRRLSSTPSTPASGPGLRLSESQAQAPPLRVTRVLNTISSSHGAPASPPRSPASQQPATDSLSLGQAQAAHAADEPQSRGPLRLAGSSPSPSQRVTESRLAATHTWATHSGALLKFIRVSYSCSHAGSWTAAWSHVAAPLHCGIKHKTT
eukprot:83964-Rhodomonas_salina.1